MVYSGPSKACARCKQRHVKCDESRPACKNCIKRKLPCPGYPDEPGIRFQDETDVVINQARERERRRSQQSSPSSRLPSPQSPALDVEEAALSFFFQNYATVGRGMQSSRGFFENVLPIYNATTPSSAMAVATSTVALSMMSAWYGKNLETRRIAQMSRRALGKALPLVRTALSDPEESLTDETLMAILLLKFHDTMMANTRSGQMSGNNHHSGAYALVKHRGHRNFRNDTSKRLLQYVRHSTVSSAIRDRTRIAEDDAIWADRVTMPQNQSTRLDAIAINFANLFAYFETQHQNRGCFHTSASNTASEILAISSIRNTAQALDDRLAAWAEQTVAIWRPITVSGPEYIAASVADAGLYREHCDIYPSIEIANIWNTYRCYRLLVLSILLKCDSAWSSDNDKAGTEVQQSPATMFQQIVDEICDSIPYHLGNRVEPGSIEQFDDSSDIEFPQKVQNEDDIQGVWTVDMTMDQDQRLKNALAQGGWHILGPISQLVEMVNGRDPTLLAPPLRPGQREWIESQQRRVMILHRVVRSIDSSSRVIEEPVEAEGSGTQRSARGVRQSARSGSRP